MRRMLTLSAVRGTSLATSRHKVAWKRGFEHNWFGSHGNSKIAYSQKRFLPGFLKSESESFVNDSIHGYSRRVHLVLEYGAT